MDSKEIKRDKLYFIIGLMAIIIVILISIIVLLFNRNNKDDKVNTTNTTNTTVKDVPFKKTYNVVDTKDGKKGFITFDNDNKCSVNFNELNSSKNVSGTIIEVKYFEGVCTYQVIDEHNLLINYTGYGALINTYYDQDKKQNIESIQQKLNVFNGVRVEFSEDYSELKTLNGNYKVLNSEVDIYFYAVDSKYKEEITTTTKLITTKKVNSTTTKSNTRTKTTTKVTDKEVVIDPKLTAALKKFDYNSYGVVLKTSDIKLEDLSYWVYIDGEEYHSYNATGNKIVGGFEFDKIGKHCKNVSVADRYGAKKDFGKLCIDFISEKLDYSAKIQKISNGQYSISFKDNNNLDGGHYNSIYNVTIYHNGKKINQDRNDEWYVGVWDTCQHNIKIVNMYNNHQEIELSC